MKEIYLAMDGNNAVFGYDNMPVSENHTWMPNMGNVYPPTALRNLGIDVTAFPITHEKPLKIRAKWEVCDEN